MNKASLNEERLCIKSRSEFINRVFVSDAGGVFKITFVEENERVDECLVVANLIMSAGTLVNLHHILNTVIEASIPAQPVGVVDIELEETFK